jgi:Glycosyltransferase Family 4
LRPDLPLPSEPLRILFTIQTLEGRAGAALYVRDFALELLRLGHRPVVFSRRLGDLAGELRDLTVPVIDRLSQLAEAPDLIHGNSPVETAAALLHFASTPAIFTCHGWDSPDALPPKFSRIVLYLAVDETCRDRLVCHEGIDPSTVAVHFNPVDLERFRLRDKPLPERPAHALVFSNQASTANYVPAIREACERFAISLEVVGSNADNTAAAPEKILGNYDLVFAKARCALEALAIGAAVILCDQSGMGSLVTTQNLREARCRNFGRRTLQFSITADSIAAEIMRYDAGDAASVTAEVRQNEGLVESTRRLIAKYCQALEIFGSFGSGPKGDAVRRPGDWHVERLSTAAFLEEIAPTANTFFLQAAVSQEQTLVRELRKKVREMELTLKTSQVPLEHRRQIRFLDLKAPSSVHAGDIFRVVVDMENRSPRLLSSYPPYPVHLAYHWLDAVGTEVLHFDGLRSEIAPALPPMGRHSYTAIVRAGEAVGLYTLRVTVVQEDVAWFDADGSGLYLDVQVNVI